MDVSAVIREHVECPICLVVPRDGVMLQCQRGHNVCALCKCKLGIVATCPQCRCDFALPPARNLTVTKLIERFPFEWACRYAKEAGCAFEGGETALATHEAACRKQVLFPCPEYVCEETVSFATVREHYDTEHNKQATLHIKPNRQGMRRFLYADDLIYSSLPYDLNYLESRFTEDCVEWAVLCAQWRKGQFFLWVLALADSEEAEKLECRFTLGHEEANSTVYYAPVYPLTWDRDKVMQDARCVRIEAARITTVLIREGLPERPRGYSEFEVRYKVSRKWC